MKLTKNNENPVNTSKLSYYYDITETFNYESMFDTIHGVRIEHLFIYFY